MPSIRCYDPSGTNDGGIHAWYRDQIRSDVQAAIDSALEMIVLQRTLNGLPQFKPLRGKCRTLAEIKVDIDTGKKHKKTKRPIIETYRILCFEGPNRDELTLLTGFKVARTTDPHVGERCV
jgi:hypothetical protein